MGLRSKKDAAGSPAKSVKKSDTASKAKDAGSNKSLSSKTTTASKKVKTVEKNQVSSKSDSGDKAMVNKSVLEKKEIKKLLQKGKERGSISFDELNDGLGPEVNSVEEIENVIALLAESDIEVIEDPSKEFPDMMVRDSDEEFEEETVEDEAEFSEFAKGNDPVRLYLSRMGSVNLLTRDGEVDIAKRIEQGEMEVLDSVLGTTICLAEILELGDRLKKGKIRVKEIVKENEPGEDGQTIEFDEPKVTERALRIMGELKVLRDRFEEQTKKSDKAKGQDRSGKMMEHQERLVELQSEIVMQLRDLKINKRQIDRIVQRIKVLVRRITKAEFELANIERMTRENSNNVLKELRAARDSNDRMMVLAKKWHQPVEVLQEWYRTIVMAIHRVKRVEEEAAVDVEAVVFAEPLRALTRRSLGALLGDLHPFCDRLAGITLQAGFDAGEPFLLAFGQDRFRRSLLRLFTADAHR